MRQLPNDSSESNAILVSGHGGRIQLCHVPPKHPATFSMQALTPSLTSHLTQPYPNHSPSFAAAFKEDSVLGGGADGAIRSDSGAAHPVSQPARNSVPLLNVHAQHRPLGVDRILQGHRKQPSDMIDIAFIDKRQSAPLAP